MSTRKLKGPEKKDSPKSKPAAKLMERSLTERPCGTVPRALVSYVTYLDDLRNYCRDFLDMFGDPSAKAPPEPAKGPVIEAIKSADTTDRDVMKALFEIADRAEDKDIRAEAQRAILMRADQAFTGLRTIH